MINEAGGEEEGWTIEKWFIFKYYSFLLEVRI